MANRDGSGSGQASGDGFSLRLYVAGNAPNSVSARATVKAMCERLGPGVSVEVVDVLRAPERALADRVFVTPMLVRLRPEPPLRIVGSLGDAVRLLEAIRGEPD